MDELGSEELEPVEPVSMEAADLPATRWRYRALAIGLALVLLAGAGALVVTPGGEPTPAQVLREVRGFVNEQRTATLTGVSESTYGSPDDPDAEPDISRLSGQIRLPDQARIVTEDDYSVEETLISGADVYYRSADSTAELAGEVWEKFNAGAMWSSGPLALPPDIDSAVLQDAAAFMSTFSAGFPLDLDTLFGKLSRAERLSPTEVKATVTLAELIPEEVRKVLEATEAEFRRADEQAEDEASEDEAEAPEDEDVDVDVEADTAFSSELNFDIPLTVTVGYGPEGRLDSLTFDIEEGAGDDYSKEHEEFRFSNWGLPVDITPPTADQVDLTPTIEEAALAEVQRQTTVMALSAPPAGWVLASAEVQELGDDDEGCRSADLQYRPVNAEINWDNPEGIAVSTVSPGCAELEESLPDMAEAKTVRIGAWTAKLSNDADNTLHFVDEGFLTAVLTVNGSTVVASTSLPEAQFIAILRSLVPLDLARQPLPPS